MASYTSEIASIKARNLSFRMNRPSRHRAIAVRRLARALQLIWIIP
jgi:hypothetical protein